MEVRGNRGGSLGLTVLELWGSAELQDLGRVGFRRFGVPVGGAFDLGAHCQANSQVGNPENCTSLELSMAHIVLRASAEVTVAVAGAHGIFTVDDKSQPGNPVLVRKGQVVRLGPPEIGARTYMAMRGGIECELILGSSSGTRVMKGDSLVSACAEPVKTECTALSVQGPMLIVPGPWFHLIPPDWLTQGEFRASMKMNRVGIRVEGGSIQRPAEIMSEPACFGGIQLTPSGELIILGPDGPTIGGYPIIAVVDPSARSKLAQVRPGDAIRFQF